MFEKLRYTVGGLVNRIAEKELKHEDFSSILWDFKLNLIENDVALIVADHICEEISKRLKYKKIKRFGDKKKIVKETLRDILIETLKLSKKNSLFSILEKKRSKKEPCIIVFIGINGTGKTTSIAKIANLLINQKYSVVFASSDTFRAGSIEQLEAHAKRLGVHVIKHKYGADAAAVAFDAALYAKSKGINAVLVDTAGRMQTNKNLLMEIKKIVEVLNPDITIFVGDALAGNDAVIQAKEFNSVVNIDGSILSKIDADAKGGAAISISYITKKPIFYFGTGQDYGDLEEFVPEKMINRLLN